ncbi:hypothetical protein LR48_Vigan10g071500 [Vigna angularis]|uniref:Uncharacterized protein n=1 Tax=Phaseolus angularis TaxID=3914 RepID=A0A0L9VIK9_PHAAN|nr:hypothetical protein LR48_Vigan10g071500 [Vigna angularis]
MESEKDTKSAKRRESASAAQRQLPLSGTFQYPLPPLRGKLALRGRIDTRYYREFGERSEEGEKGNQKRHQKVQKEESQLPLSGSLPLSGTQKVTGGPLRGKMTAEGKNRARALTAEQHFYGLGPNFSVIYE